MVSDFLLPQSQLNLFSLLPQQQKTLANFGIPFKTTIYLEYGKIEEKYQTKEYLLDQIKSKALPIRKTLYPGYELLFMFDNTISYAIYAKDAL